MYYLRSHLGPYYLIKHVTVHLKRAENTTCHFEDRLPISLILCRI